MLILSVLFICVSSAMFLKSCTYTNSNCSIPLTCTLYPINQCLISSTLSSFTHSLSHHSYMLKQENGEILKYTYNTDNCNREYVITPMYLSQGKCEQFLGDIYVTNERILRKDDGNIASFQNNIISLNENKNCDIKTSVETFYEGCIDNLDGTFIQHSVKNNALYFNYFTDKDCLIPINKQSVYQCDSCVHSTHGSIHYSKKVVCE